jgi:putative transposase
MTTDTILRAYKVRLDPTIEQLHYLERCTGVARATYNWTLASWRKWYRWHLLHKRGHGARARALIIRWGGTPPAWDASKKPTAYSLHGELTEIKHQQFPWMTEVSSYVVREATNDVGLAYKNFFRRLKAGEKGRAAGAPRFRSKRPNGGWHADQGSALDVRHGAVWCPGLARKGAKNEELGWIRVANGQRGFIPIGLKLCGVGFSRVAGKWYASMRASAPRPVAPEKRTERLGVEVGVRHLAVTSSGHEFTAVRDVAMLPALERRLKLWQRRAARRFVKGRKMRDQSARWRSAQAEVAKYYAAVARCRADLLHKTSRTIVDIGASTVIVRDMRVRDMIRRDNKRTTEDQRARNALAPMVAKVGMYELRRQLEYKQSWAGRTVMVAPNDHPTTRMCSACGVVRETEPGYPGWRCAACGVQHDREHNAAINLRDFSSSSDGGKGSGRTARDKSTTSGGTGQLGEAQAISDAPDGSATSALGSAKQARPKGRGKRARKGDATAIPVGNGGGASTESIDTGERRGDATALGKRNQRVTLGARGTKRSRSQRGGQDRELQGS